MASGDSVPSLLGVPTVNSLFINIDPEGSHIVHPSEEREKRKAQKDLEKAEKLKRQKEDTEEKERRRQAEREANNMETENQAAGEGTSSANVPTEAAPAVSADRQEARNLARSICARVCNHFNLGNNIDVARVMGILSGILHNSLPGTPAKVASKKMAKKDVKSFDKKQKEKAESQPHAKISKDKVWDFSTLFVEDIEKLRNHEQLNEAKKLLVRGALWTKRRNLFNRVPQNVDLETVGGLPFGSPDEVRAYPGAFGGKASNDIHGSFNCKKTPFCPLPTFVVNGKDMEIGDEFPGIEARDLLSCIGDGLQDAVMLECIAGDPGKLILTGVLLEGDGLIKFRKQGWGLASIDVSDEGTGMNTVKIKRKNGFEVLPATGTPVMKKMRVDNIK